MNLHYNKNFEIKDRIIKYNQLSNLIDEEIHPLYNIFNKIFNCEIIEDGYEKYFYIPNTEYNLLKLKDLNNSQELLDYYSKEIAKYKYEFKNNLQIGKVYIDIAPKVEEDHIELNYTIYFSEENDEENKFISSINKLKWILNKKSIEVELIKNGSIVIISENENEEIISNLINNNIKIKAFKNKIIIKDSIYE